ncbi:MAG: hypothetical protein BAA03_14120 [Caldibacillus debilis]|nr:MAG: hypothetical protein BAA03_14120 [Caldibacillus debilis]
MPMQRITKNKNRNGIIAHLDRKWKSPYIHLYACQPPFIRKNSETTRGEKTFGRNVRSGRHINLW